MSAAFHTTYDEYGNLLEVVAYASILAQYDETDAKPDSKTINVYERNDT